MYSRKSPSALTFDRTWIVVFILLTALAIQCAYSAWSQGQTTDEPFFSASGYPMVRYNNYEFLGEHPPLTMQLGALPLLFLRPKFPIQDPLYVPGTDRLDLTKNGLLFLYRMGNAPQFILFLERLPIIGLTILLGLGIFLFGKELYGSRGGLLALGLYCFCPNIIAQGSLYTTDMGLTVFYFFSIFMLQKFFAAPSDGRIAATGIACGLTFMSKISGLILIPVISCLFLVYFLSKRNSLQIITPSSQFEKIVCAFSLFLVINALGEKQAMVLFGPFLICALYFMGREMPKILASRPLRFIFRMLIAGGAALCMIYSWRLKKKYGISMASILMAGTLAFIAFSIFMARASASSNSIRLMKYYLSLWVFAILVIVLGYTDIVYKLHRLIGFGNFMKPLGIVLSHSGGGHGSCVEGSFITCDWRYFLGVMAIKTPVLTLFLAGLGAFLLLRSHRPVLIKALLFVPPIFFLGVAMTNKINIGLRHILPIYPFLFLLGGLPGAMIATMPAGILKKTLAGCLFILLAFFAVRTIWTGPDYLAYFNEVVGGPEQGSKLVGDSNLNWGQDNKRLAEFVIASNIPSIKIASEASNSDLYDHYKIPWQWMKENDFSDPGAGFYALGIGIFKRQQTDPRSWFRNRIPLFRVGKTFYIFKIPETPRL